MCAAGKYGMQGATSAPEAACTDCEAGKFSATEGVFICVYNSVNSFAFACFCSIYARCGGCWLGTYVCMYVGMYVNAYVYSLISPSNTAL